jgi:hypothetical protein
MDTIVLCRFSYLQKKFKNCAESNLDKNQSKVLFFFTMNSFHLWQKKKSINHTVPLFRKSILSDLQLSFFEIFRNQRSSGSFFFIFKIKGPMVW